MGFLDSIKKATQTFIEDLNTPESFKKGQKFEDFVRTVIFPSDRYKLIRKTHDYKQNSSDFVHDTLEPDFKFECIETKRQFHLEAKYRSSTYQEKIEFCKDGQYKRLHEINRKEPVFIVLGIEGVPEDPEYVCLIPMSEIKSTVLTVDFLEGYDIAHNKSISPKLLWSIGNQKTGKTRAEIKEQPTPVTRNSHIGHCIRCNEEIKKDNTHPLCKTCYTDWNKYKNLDYTEKYCHTCGNKNRSSFSKPTCYSCFKKNN